MQVAGLVRRSTWMDRVLLTVLAGLFVVPLVILVFADRPARYSFQMFSGYGDVSASWEDASGVEHPVDLDDHLASVRGEVDWTALLPSALCERIPDAIRVDVARTQPGEDDRRSLMC